MKEIIKEVFESLQLKQKVSLVSIIPVSSPQEIITENKILKAPKVSTYDVTLQSEKKYLPNLIITEFDSVENISQSIANHVYKHA